jgi:hypothetical protein
MEKQSGQLMDFGLGDGVVPVASSASVPVFRGVGDLCLDVMGEFSPVSKPGNFAAELVAEVDGGSIQG